MKNIENIKFLFIGDIVAKFGRKTIIKVLPKLKTDLNITFVSANCENIAHGSGVTKASLDEILSAGVDFCTSGDHIFKNPTNLIEVFENYPVLRPANYPDGVIGNGYKIININGYKILFINLIGRVFMKGDFDCPFRKFDSIYEENKRKKINCIIVDFHAEATSEKKAFFEYVKTRANIVFGTHTHVGTSDLENINNKAYITDIGMVGAKNSSLGVDFKNIINTFLYQTPQKHEFPEDGEYLFNSVLVEYNPVKKEVIKVNRIDRIGTL